MSAFKPTPPAPQPTAFKVRKQSRVMEVSFDDGVEFSLTFELLRVYSPSAEVRGHGPGQETLQLGKREVEIVTLEPVGNYGVKPVFSDGHDSGIYTWEYLQQLEAAGYTRESGREPGAQASPAFNSGAGCGSGHLH